MNRNSVYVRVLLVVVSVVVLLVFVNRAPQKTPRDTWLPSSFNPVGSGHMALFQTLFELGWPVERWREPLVRLDDFGKGNVLVVARSQFGSRVMFSDQEIDLLDDWVKAGNTMILLGAVGEWDDTRGFLHQLGFNLQEKRESVSSLFAPLRKKDAAVLEIPPDALSGQTGVLVLPPTEPLPISYPAGSRVLYEKQGQPYLLDVPRGGGHVIVGASDQMLDNDYLGHGDNLAIVLQMFAPAGHVPPHVFFEESHHGFSAIFALARLFDHPGVRFAGMLALLGSLTFLGSALLRFGPRLPVQRDSGRSTLEFVDSIADLYLRADLRNETIKSLFTDTHERVLQRLNLPPTASHELVASRLQLAHPQLPPWKKLAQRFDSRDYMDGLPPTGWLKVARQLIEIKSAMA